MNRSIAIIGGGITGLTAAYRLTQRGLPVTLYEGSGRTGGVIQSVRRDGYLAECGPNSILETSPKITQLVRDLGLEKRRLESNPSAKNRYLVCRGKLVNMPASLGGFLATPLFSWQAKLRLFAEPFIGRAPANAEESVAEFVERRLGSEFLERAIDALVGGIYAGDPKALSVVHGFPKLHALEQKYGSLIRGQIFGAAERRRRAEVSKQNAPKFSFDEGLQVLTDALTGQLGSAVQWNARVQRLTQTPQHWRVGGLRDGELFEAEHAAVLFAAPPHRLPELNLLNQDRVNWRPLAQIHYPPVASVVLGFRRQDVPHPLDGFGMLIPKREGFSILGTIFSSSLFPNRAPAGHVTLTSYLGGARCPELALRPENELIARTVKDLQTLLRIQGQPTFEHMTLFAKAIPQYEIGYGRFKNLMGELESAAPGLFLAGHFRDGISLGDSLLSGDAVAARIASHLASNNASSFTPAPSLA
jgi:protoporphyrinogen/coproporphyrinogen III oxidase